MSHFPAHAMLSRLYEAGRAHAYGELTFKAAV